MNLPGKQSHHLVALFAGLRLELQSFLAGLLDVQIHLELHHLACHHLGVHHYLAVLVGGVEFLSARGLVGELIPALAIHYPIVSMGFHSS